VDRGEEGSNLDLDDALQIASQGEESRQASSEHPLRVQETQGDQAGLDSRPCRDPLPF
jgi:hypothetical protein